jgi:hypothetical protein
VLNLGERTQAGLVSRDLLDPGGNFAVNATASLVAHPLDPAMQTNSTDNQMIRLQDWQPAGIQERLFGSDVLPQPECIHIDNLASGRWRNAMYLFRSTDAGQSWVLCR